MEQPDEIRERLERTPDNVKPLFDTAHYQPYGDVLDDVGYDGHQTIEIENRRELPLVHAKQNMDHLRRASDNV